MKQKLINAGDFVITPRFSKVRIWQVFNTEQEARESGYTEQSYFEDPGFGVLGKVLDMEHIRFAAYRKES